jgi:hypothetical protein
MFDGHLETEGNRGCLSLAVFGLIGGLVMVWTGLGEPDWFEVGVGVLVAFVACILSWRIAHDVDEESPIQSVIVRLFTQSVEMFGIQTRKKHDE